MMFWFIAAAIAVLAAAYVAWPLLKDRPAVRNYGVALLLLFPVAALFLYQSVGTPEGIGVSGRPGQQAVASNHPGQVNQEIDAMVARLENRLQENPADTEGWMLLGRTYKTMQMYAQAESALVRAAQLAPEDPLVMVELAEARLFTSSDPVIGTDIRNTLERVLEIEPNQQKALWLLGIAETQAGENRRALELWQRLSDQLEPGSPMKTSIEQQMSELRNRAGAEATPSPVQVPAAPEARPGPEEEEDEDTLPADPAGGWSGLRVDVQAPDGLGDLPANAALFIIVRNPSAPTPPLGVARMSRPSFPAIAFISDRNSMLENMPISALEEIEVLVRLSMSGSPAARPGDLESETVSVRLAETDRIALELLTD